jgi:hypothetical protein
MATLMDSALSFSRPNVPLAVRTLLLSGYTIENNRRQPTHTEIDCTAPLLGISIPLLIAITEEDELPPIVRQQLRLVAKRANRNLVIITAATSDENMGWLDFLEAFGGAVASWRALGSTYLDQLTTAAKNAKPDGFEGEAWRLFELLVADGLEFCFARRVRRLGAAKRGQRVSDMITQIPEGDVLVVDAKATATSFNAATHELRPLVEYTKNQRIRQKGSFNVFGALMVSSAFDQNEQSLTAISKEFISETGVPIAFLEVSVLVHFITVIKAIPHVRSGLRWRRLFSGGLVSVEAFDTEIAALRGERY